MSLFINDVKYPVTDGNLLLSVFLDSINTSNRIVTLGGAEIDDSKYTVGSLLGAKDLAVNTEESYRANIELETRYDGLDNFVGVNAVGLIELLIDAGYDPSMNNNEALITAAGSGYNNVVDRLLEEEGDVLLSVGEALIEASGHGHLDIVSTLLEYSHYQDDLDSALVQSVRHAHFDILDKLLSNGASVTPGATNLAGSVYNKLMKVLDSGAYIAIQHKPLH